LGRAQPRAGRLCRGRRRRVDRSRESGGGLSP
jgi:hypothetical protein